MLPETSWVPSALNAAAFAVKGDPTDWPVAVSQSWTESSKSQPETIREPSGLKAKMVTAWYVLLVIG